MSASHKKVTSADWFRDNTVCNGSWLSENEVPGGCSSMAEQELPKLKTRVRFSSPAPSLHFDRQNLLTP